jgi:hypothetical protein
MEGTISIRPSARQGAIFPCTAKLVGLDAKNVLQLFKGGTSYTVDVIGEGATPEVGDLAEGSGPETVMPEVGDLIEVFQGQVLTLLQGEDNPNADFKVVEGRFERLKGDALRDEDDVHPAVVVIR